jgi:AcrR family transcriptional regulator
MARRRRRDGEDSRNAILGAAARLATVEGIEGLSISRLADEVGMSKSGLFAHFGSKEDLQLATVETASAIFAAQVTAPAATAPTGSERLRRLIDGYLRYTQVETFPGGCFFASVLAEVSMRPGAIRDRMVEFLGDWLGEVEAAVRAAQAEGAIDPAEDPAQLTFEIEAALFLANTQYVVAREAAPLERARRAIERRLERPS